MAFASGKVTYSGVVGGYGQMVIVSHSNGLESQYAHLSSLAVKTGQKVKSGVKIGAVGSTGLSTGPHLHLKEIDPMSFFKK